MRKRTINTIADTTFWYLIYFLPVIVYLIYMISISPNGGIPTFTNFIDFINATGFNIVTDNFLITTLKDIFGTSGLLPLFNTDVPFIIFGWFINCVIAHLFIDFILFIPRLSHKWLNKFTKEN